MSDIVLDLLENQGYNPLRLVYVEEKPVNH